MNSDKYDVFREMYDYVNDLRKHLNSEEKAHLDEVLKIVLEDVRQYTSDDHELFRQIKTKLAPFEAMIEARRAKGLYDLIRWPALVIGVFGWILLCVSCINAEEEQWTLIISRKSILWIYVCAFCLLVLGQLFNTGITLAGMKSGAVGQNQVLSKRVSLFYILRPGLLKVAYLLFMSMLVLLLHRVVVWAADHQIIEGITTLREEIVWAISCGFLTVPAIASSAVALSVISVVTIGSPSEEYAGRTWMALIALLFTLGLLVLAGYILSTKENGSGPFEMSAGILFILFIGMVQAGASCLFSVGLVARSSWCTAIIIVGAAIVWRIALLS